MKITSIFEWGLLVAATILNGILAGDSLIKPVVEPPARRKIGLPAMAAYHRAADLRTGFLIYPPLGLGAPALTIALGFAFAFDPGAPATAGSLVPRCGALGVPRFRDDSGGPELALPPFWDARRGGPRTRLPGVCAMADGAGDPFGPAFVAVVLVVASLVPFGQ